MGDQGLVHELLVFGWTPSWSSSLLGATTILILSAMGVGNEQGDGVVIVAGDGKVLSYVNNRRAYQRMPLWIYGCMQVPPISFKAWLKTPLVGLVANTPG